MQFTFGEYKTTLTINQELPKLDFFTDNINNTLIIADENTKEIASGIRANFQIPVCVLKSGEENKNWQQIERILQNAAECKLGRDCLFIAAGGGVLCDLAAFASSIYMRGCNLALVPTTVLAMTDASVGGKTGFDFCGIKNLAGTFYPANFVYIAFNCLKSLSQREWKSGFAEIIKTAVLSGDDFLEKLEKFKFDKQKPQDFFNINNTGLFDCIEKAVNYKAFIVSEDLRESGVRKLLNLGHTFAHALESVMGLGNVSHGEAVAWGLNRACKLGVMLGITPQKRAERITNLLASFGYESEYSFEKDDLLEAMKSDKKKRDGKLSFIVPCEDSAKIIFMENQSDLEILKETLN